MHKDKNGQLLKEGFYIKDTLGGLVLYFTGKYDAQGNAITEGHAELYGYPESKTCEWKSFTSVEDYLEHARGLVEVINLNCAWLERKQSQLEKEANKPNLSAQNKIPQGLEPVVDSTLPFDDPLRYAARPNPSPEDDIPL
ncbi:hypothetical protein HY449_04865 [Candidatus Pacearchaeota archaeon]|nr:hypothetical protein [Candidatus Pacearchaeota archaeon]